METLNNNILIAEFMGGKVKSESILNIKDNEIFIPFHGVCDLGNSGKGLKYHNSWDWLMPVVEKIETTHFTFKNYVNHYAEKKDLKSSDAWILTSYDNREEFKGWDVNIELESLSKQFCSTKGENPRYQTKIEATYNVVVDFIKFYNENRLV